MIDNRSEQVMILHEKHKHDCPSCPLQAHCAFRHNDTKETYDARMNAAAQLINEVKA